MNFFKYFPRTSYQFGGFELTITNPTVHVKLVQRLKQHIEAFYDYVVQDGERPDTVATKLYGSPAYTWVILVVNNILSLYDWPLNSDEFTLYINDKYTSIAAAQAIPVYKTVDGFYIDAVSFNLLDGSQRGTVETAYDDELLKNDAKRYIKVIPAAFVEPLVFELQNIFTNG